MNKKRVYLISCGVGGAEDITLRALKAIECCEILMGAERFIKLFAEGRRSVVIPAYVAKAAEVIDNAEESVVGVLLSGDAGFYSQATGLRKLLKNADIETIPGVGIVQELAARLNIAWQDFSFLSLHAKNDDTKIPEGSCIILMRAGLDLRDFIEPSADKTVWICHAIATPDESIEVWNGESYICKELTTVVIATLIPSPIGGGCP